MGLPLLTVPLWLLFMKFFSALRLCASAPLRENILSASFFSVIV